MNGILNVNKPRGWTSFDVVNFVRGRSRVKRVGHAGTLDPAAEGVLPVLLGQATRLTEYLVDASKTYAAIIELGAETDTYDAEGEVVSRTDASSLTRDAVEAALAAFRGEFDQTPPIYSAIKRDGQPLYKAARRGIDVEAPPARRVTVHRLDLTAYEPPLVHVEVDCSKGFYVRSLAHDLGAALGVGGHLANLVRTRVGSFRLEDAVELDTLRLELESDAWQQRLFAPDEVLLRWQAAILGEANEQRLRRGQTTLFEAGETSGAHCRAYNATGDFLGILRSAGEGAWRPEKVFTGTGNQEHGT